jgi:hypothetical protein
VREYGGAATAVPDKERPTAPPDEERDLDYLICRECNSPCYTFEMEKGKLTEAQCLVCGNEDLIQFNIGEEEPDE